MNKIFLVIYSKKLGRYFTKYFDTEYQKDKYKFYLISLNLMDGKLSH